MKKKIKYKNIFLLILLLIFILLMFFSIYKIVTWYKDNKNTNKQINYINDKVDIKEKKDNDNTQNINPPKDKSNPYWDYIGMNLLDVDFNELKSINSSTKGWIKVNGTTINYPFVQEKDNDFYLTHSFDKKYNEAGWIYLDYRNNISNLDKNTIIYGHGRLNKVMFGSLKNIIKSDWYDDKENYVIKMSTDNENTLWQVFSVYKIPTTSDYLQIDFSSDKEYTDFLNKLQKRSVFKFPIELNEKDKIITLSTCYNDKEKVVMHAKLIKLEKK